MKAKRRQEDKQRSVELHDDSLYIFGRLLQFFYFGNFFTHSADKTSVVPVSIRGLVIGDETSTLTEEREADHIADLFRSPKETTLCVYDLARKYRMPNLKECVIKRFKNLRIDDVEDLRATFGKYMAIDPEEDKSLRNVVANKIASLYRDIRKGDSNTCKAIRRWMEEDIELSFLVMDALAARAQG